jgi:hypothetical protein
MPDFSPAVSPVFPGSTDGGGFSIGMNSHPALEASGAKVVDQLSGVGVGFTILFLLVLLQFFVIYMQFRRNNSLVDQILGIVPNATATVLQAVADFKAAIKEFTGAK